MRILHVFKDYFPPTRGGIENHINELVHLLPGFEHSVLTSSRSRQMTVDEDRGVRVIRTPELARPVSTPLTPVWSRLLRKSGADLFHFHMPNPFGELSFLASRARSPMVASFHADIVGRSALRPMFRPFQQRFLKRAVRIAVSNPRLLASSRALKSHIDRAVMIPYGVDLQEWQLRPPAADDIRSRYPGPLLLFLGRLVYYKGVEVLLKAMHSLEATLLIVGVGPLRPELQSVTRQLALDEKVAFIGEVPDEERAAYYHAADLFVLPSTSRAEAFGLSMLEAMACGTPALSTEVGTGTSWLNLPGKTGLVVRPGDPAALAGAVKIMLADKEKLSEMGEAAVSRVVEHFTRDLMLSRIANLYETAVTD